MIFPTSHQRYVVVISKTELYVLCFWWSFKCYYCSSLSHIAICRQENLKYVWCMLCLCLGWRLWSLHNVFRLYSSLVCCEKSSLWLNTMFLVLSHRWDLSLNVNSVLWKHTKQFVLCITLSVEFLLKVCNRYLEFHMLCCKKRLNWGSYNQSIQLRCFLIWLVSCLIFCLCWRWLCQVMQRCHSCTLVCPPPHYVWPNILCLSVLCVAWCGQKNLRIRLQSTSYLFITLNLLILGLFFSFSIMITSEVVHLVIGTPIEVDALINVLWSCNMEVLKRMMFLTFSFPSKISKHL